MRQETIDRLNSIIDGKYENLEGMDTEDIITYLMDGFDATRDEAIAAVEGVF